VNPPPVPTAPPILEVAHLKKSFGPRVVLSDISFSVPSGAILSILGRSGTGKSVLLKCIVGLLHADSGQTSYKGEPLADKAQMRTLRQSASYVFQQNALFDSATVYENVLLPLQARGSGPRDEWDTRVREVLQRLELEEAAERYPSELSGGMQKRLAVARALVTKPELVFFDEPTAGLDPLRRNAVFEMISKLQKESKFTAIVVTHDVQEALIVSSRILWLDSGNVRFDGSAEDFGASGAPEICAFRDNIGALREAVRSTQTTITG
jgi:phospholipid/cholesterol/gamma-HCH transport system ATP-binding protein